MFVCFFAKCMFSTHFSNWSIHLLIVVTAMMLITASCVQFLNSLRNCWATWRLTSPVSRQPSPGYPPWPCGCRCPRGTSSAVWPAGGPKSWLRTSHRPRSRCRCPADQSPRTFPAHRLRLVALTSPPCSRRPPPKTTMYSTVRLVPLTLRQQLISGLKRASAAQLDFVLKRLEL